MSAVSVHDRLIYAYVHMRKHFKANSVTENSGLLISYPMVISIVNIDTLNILIKSLERRSSLILTTLYLQVSVHQQLKRNQLWSMLIPPTAAHPFTVIRCSSQRNFLKGKNHMCLL